MPLLVGKAVALFRTQIEIAPAVFSSMLSANE